MAAQSGYYGSLAELAAVYAHGIAKNHPFVDGNKRAALGAAGMFLNAHGFDLQLGMTWVKNMENVASVELSREDLVTLFAAAMGKDISIETKLELVRDLTPELRALARRGWSWKALATMMSPRVAISPDLLQSYVRGRSRATRKAKAEGAVAPTSRDRAGAPKADTANETSRSLPRPPARPAPIHAAPTEELDAEDAWGTDDDHVTGRVGAS